MAEELLTGPDKALPVDPQLGSGCVERLVKLPVLPCLHAPMQLKPSLVRFCDRAERRLHECMAQRNNTNALIGQRYNFCHSIAPLETRPFMLPADGAWSAVVTWEAV